jgi:hypothetical protein
MTAGRPRITILALTIGLCACAMTETTSPTATSVEPSATAQASSASSVPSAPPAGWTRVPISGSTPVGREDHTWTVAPDGTAFLFGGRDGATVLDDLWAFSLDRGTWSQISPSGVSPPARFGHNAAWVPGIGLVIFAGQGPTGFFNDLWAYDPDSTTWRRLPATGAIPVSRYGSCASLGLDARLWISHGFTSDGQRFADTRAYDFAAGAWTDETPVGDAPIRRCLHACWWTDDGALVLYGGQTTGTTALGDLWRLTIGERPGTNAWTLLEADGGLPPARNLYAAARWGAGTILFGGQGLDGSYLADTWWLADAGGADQLAVSAPTPAARSGAELIADAAHGRLVLVGGRDGTAAFDDLWQLVAPTAP